MAVRRLALHGTAIAAGAAAAVLGLPAASQAAAPEATVTVVARGLDNPRGLTVGPDGAVYVAEAGRGGPNCIDSPFGEFCAGFTGGVTKVADGRQSRVVRNVASAAGPDGSFAGGITDVAVRGDGTIWGIVNGLGCRIPPGFPPEFNQQAVNLVAFAPDGVPRRPVADLTANECRNNPDGADRNPNPYGLELGADGNAYIADAGGNYLAKVTPGGRVTTHAVFHARSFGGNQVQSVPTSVGRGPDGSLYVGMYGGGGTPRHQAYVVKVTPSGRKTFVTAGFDTISGVAVGRDGSLYVTELLAKGESQVATGDLTGSLWRVRPDGSKTELAKGQLQVPAGAAVGPDGSVYVSTGSVFPGGGAVVKVTP